jgi:hypothetical protein
MVQGVTQNVDELEGKARTAKVSDALLRAVEAAEPQQRFSSVCVPPSAR